LRIRLSYSRSRKLGTEAGRPQGKAMRRERHHRILSRTLQNKSTSFPGRMSQLESTDEFGVTSFGFSDLSIFSCIV